MLALITGASSGIGRDMARTLSRMGYDLILVARREDRLLNLKQDLKTDVSILPLDLSVQENCFKLLHITQEMDIDILINNAGFGLFGDFYTTDLDTEIKMINTNIRAVHILTKEFYRRFRDKNNGWILNVASSAAFAPGPLMSTYYASKAYVLRLSMAIYEEARRDGSNIHISILCPGPVKTEFDEKADVQFSLKGLNSEEVAVYALNQMFRNQLIIIPGMIMKTAKFIERFLPDKLLLRAAYHMQQRKNAKKRVIR